MNFIPTSVVAAVPGAGRRSDDTEPMGFDPQRRRVERSTDALFVAAALVVAAVLVAWAFLG